MNHEFLVYNSNASHVAQTVSEERKRVFSREFRGFLFNTTLERYAMKTNQIIDILGDTQVPAIGFGQYAAGARAVTNASFNMDNCC